MTSISDMFDGSAVVFSSSTSQSSGKEAVEHIATEWIADDSENPLHFSALRKWFVVVSISLFCFWISFSSSGFIGAIPGIMNDFDVSSLVAIVGVSMVLLGFTLGPLFLAPLSEMYGRKPVYVACMAVFTAFQIGCALAENIETILICRFFIGLAGSGPLTNGAGSLADVFVARDRARAVTLYVGTIFLGPVIGPIVGSAIIVTQISWRWVFWIVLVVGALLTVLACLMPETYGPVLLKKRSKKLRLETGKNHRSAADLQAMELSLWARLKLNLTRPFRLLFGEIIVLLLSIWVAIIYGILYLFFKAIPLIYVQVYGFNALEASLPFIGIGVGVLFGLIATVYSSRLYERAIDPATGRAPPEARLYSAMWGGVVFPVSLFWFAWTCFPSVHWIVSILSLPLFGFGLLVIFISCIYYVVDSYLMFAASALAGNSFLRSLFGAVFPLFAGVMYANLGVNWASTLLAFLGLICAPLPFIFFKYGESIRAMSKIAPK